MKEPACPRLSASLQPSILSDASASLNEKTSTFSTKKLLLLRSQGDVHSEFCCFDPVAEVFKSTSDLFKLDQDVPRSSLNTQEKRLPNVADWKGTLDFVTSMTGVAGDQRNHLREQTEAQQRALEDVRRELNETRQRLQASEQRAHELRFKRIVDCKRSRRVWTRKWRKSVSRLRDTGTRDLRSERRSDPRHKETGSRG